MKTKIRRSGVPIDIDESKMCPFAELYDADLHNFCLTCVGLMALFQCIRSMAHRSIFSLLKIRKYWIRASTPVLGYFLFLVLDKVVCPFLVKYFEMPIWHPTSERTLDELLDAKVDL
jgi:hypothetical protein